MNRTSIRVVLGLTLSLLLISAAHFSLSTAVASATATSSTTSSSSTSTTTVVSNAEAAFQSPQRGCGMHLSGPTTYPRSIGHCTIMWIGDSLGEDMSWGMVKEIAKYPEVNLVLNGKSSTGLANTPYYSWPLHLRSMLATSHPHLLIVGIGGNDGQSLQADGHVYRFGTPEWKVAYAHQVSIVVHEALAAHAMVLWVGLPIMQPWGYWQKIQTLNGIYRQVVTSIPGARYLDTWNVLSHPTGVFASSAPVNGVISQLRSADGIHMWPKGEAVIATYIVRYIDATYNMPFVPQENAVITK